MSNIFSEGTNTPVPPQEDDKLGVIELQLDSIKNDQGGRKYDSLDKALEALKHSQEYIPTLKKQLEEKDKELLDLRSNSMSQDKLESLVAKLLDNNNKPEGGVPTPTSQGLDESKVLGLISKSLSERADAEYALKNVQSVHDALTQKFGDRVNDVVAAKAKELGLSLQDLEALSKKSPAVVLTLFGTQSQPSSPARSSVSIPPTRPDPSEVVKPQKSLLVGASSKDQSSYFQELRKSVYNKHNISS